MLLPLLAERAGIPYLRCQPDLLRGLSDNDNNLAQPRAARVAGVPTERPWAILSQGRQHDPPEQMPPGEPLTVIKPNASLGPELSGRDAHDWDGGESPDRAHIMPTAMMPVDPSRSI